MRIEMHGESDLTLSNLREPDFQIVQGEHAYSAMQMFGTSLALCSLSVLAAYAEQLGVGIEKLSCRIRWDYVEDPFRIGEIDMEITWPELPPSRLEAARRAAEKCTIHNTLHHPPEVRTRVSNGGP